MFDPNPRDFLRRFYYAISGDALPGSWPMNLTASDALLDGLADPQAFPAWMSERDLDYYVGEFTRSGFFGPLSRYRNHTRDFHYLQQFKGRRIEQPAFFVAGTRDGAFNMFGAAGDPIAGTPACRTRGRAHVSRAATLDAAGAAGGGERAAGAVARDAPRPRGLS